MLKIHYRQQTFLLLQENENLRELLGIRQVGKVVKPTTLDERVIQAYKEGLNRTLGPLCIDGTTIEAREKPFVRVGEAIIPVTQKKIGRKKKGSPEEKANLEAKAETQRENRGYLEESPEKYLAELEMGCSMT
jgi:hypothetical protein